MPSPSRIPAFRVPLADIRNGIITTEWFTFFSSLFTLTGSGTNTTSIPDMLVGPPEQADTSNETTKVLQALSVEPPIIPYTGGIETTVTAVLDFPNTAANAVSDLNVTLAGAVSGDVVTLGVPNGSVPAGGTFFAWVSAANTITVRFANNTAGALDPASGTFRVSVVRF